MLQFRILVSIKLANDSSQARTALQGTLEVVVKEGELFFMKGVGNNSTSTKGKTFGIPGEIKKKLQNAHQ